MNWNNLGMLGASILQANAMPNFGNTGLLTARAMAQYPLMLAANQKSQREQQQALLQQQQMKMQMEQMKREQELAAQQQKHREQFISTLPPKEQIKYRAYPKKAGEAMFRKPEQRRMYKGADGYNYWADNNARVNPSVQMKPSDTMVKTIGENGQVVYTPQNQAAGMPAYVSSGISMTTPGGSTVTIGGPYLGGEDSTSGQKQVEKDISKKLFNAQEQKARVSRIRNSFKPEYLGIPFKLKRFWTEMQDWMKSGNITPEQKQLLTQYTTFARRTAENANLYIKDLTGAQMSEDEADRLMTGVPSERDSPTVFESKINDVMDFVSLSIMRYQYALAEGNPDGWKNIPLDRNTILEKRGEQLASQLKRVNPGIDEKEIDSIVTERLIQELGE